jgi:hypothetical protein
MDIHNHKKESMSIEMTVEYESIEDFSDELIRNNYGSYETAYSKDSMTDGQLPTYHLIKAIYRYYTTINDLNTDKFTIKDFLENIKKSIDDLKDMEEEYTKDLMCK